MKRAAIAAVLLLLSWLSWKVFPGHTWLQQDTQIYVPILEHLRDPNVLGKDILVEHPHVSFTLYDELTLGLCKITGLGIEPILDGLQILFRAAGLLGVFLIGASLGLSTPGCLLVTVLWSFGATAKGPEVLTVEYEAVPRGFAFPLLMLAVGLAANNKWRGSGFATAAAALLHPPTVWPVLAVYCWKRRLQPLLIVMAGVLFLFMLAKLQPGPAESQRFFSVLSPGLEALQRMRASYNWVDTWWREWLPEYLFLSLLGWLAVKRLGDRVSAGLRSFVTGLPVLGLLSMPATYLALNEAKLALIPQLQPMRALLFTIALASVLAAAAGCTAAEKRQLPEAFLWFLIPCLLPIQAKLFALPTGPQAAVWLSLVLLCVISVRQLWLIPLLSASCLALAAVVTLFPRMHSAELSELSRWAAANTPSDAVFLFADNGKGNAPGIFRSEALRAVYADWKGGGQVNYLPEFAEEWHRRWQLMRQPDGPSYKTLGVDYIMMNVGHELPSAVRVYGNSRYWVYKTK